MRFYGGLTSRALLAVAVNHGCVSALEPMLHERPEWVRAGRRFW